MTAKRANHVIPKANGWSVKKTGASRATRTFDTKEKALLFARVLSINEQTELYVHRANGTIQNRNSYGNVPNIPKDTK